MAIATNEQSVVDGVEKRLYIGGEWRDASGGETIPIEDPATEETLTEVADATPDDAAAALDAACGMQKEWGDTAPNERSEILYKAFEMFEARLEKLTQALEDVMLLDVPSRLAKYILDSGDGQPDPHALTLTQDEIAAAVGSTRVTINKVLADFEQRGLIRVARRHIDVLSPDRLRKEIHG